MPGFDRTGPEGKGSRTGRGLGKCNPGNQQSDEQMIYDDTGRGLGRRLRNMARGRGPARGFGRGLGRGRW